MSPRLSSVVAALLIPALAPLLLAEEKAPKVTLLDDEVRAWLEPAETTAWDKLARERTDAERQIARGKSMATSRESAGFKGQGESPEQKKAKGDALVKSGEEKLAALAKSREDLRRAADERVTGAAVSAPCPIAPLATALDAGSRELAVAARKAGYRGITCGGVLVASRGKPVSRDPSLSELFVEKLNEALVAAGDAPEGAKASGVILAEVQPVDPALGAILSMRLTDAKSGAVRRVITALVPAETPGQGQARRGRYGEPEAYAVTFRDTRNFLGKLGPASSWDFEVEGDGPAGALLKAALVVQGAPVVVEPGVLTRVGVRGAKAEAKALWVVSPEPESPGVWRVSSRAATAGAKPVPVGTVTLAPAPKAESR